MNCSSLMTYLSTTSRAITQGERAGQTYFQAHFLDSTERPVSFSVDGAMSARLLNEFLLGDSVVCDLEILTTQKGTFTRLINISKR